MQIFAFWDRKDRAPIEDFHDHWKSIFTNFKIYTDEEVVEMLYNRFPRYVKYYKNINIPAAKSDIARLVILYEKGGLYIDCHCGCKNYEGLVSLLGELSVCSVSLVDNAMRGSNRPPGSLRIINSVIFSKANQRFILLALIRALRNIRSQWNKQKCGDSFGYNIWSLTGPLLYHMLICDDFRLDSFSGFSYENIRNKFKDIVIMEEASLPISRNCFHGYREPGQHWSERQKIEPLFK